MFICIMNVWFCRKELFTAPPIVVIPHVWKLMKELCIPVFCAAAASCAPILAELLVRE